MWKNKEAAKLLILNWVKRISNCIINYLCLIKSQNLFNVLEMLKKYFFSLLLPPHSLNAVDAHTCHVFLLNVRNYSQEVSNIIRSSHRRCSVKKVLLEISQNSQENICASVSFLMKLQAWGLCHKCFSVNFENFLKIPFFKEQFYERYTSNKKQLFYCYYFIFI